MGFVTGNKIQDFAKSQLPVQVMNAQLKGNYDFQHLSYIIKNMLRASYNPDNGRFEPLIICGTYNDEYGVR